MQAKSKTYINILILKAIYSNLRAKFYDLVRVIWFQR